MGNIYVPQAMKASVIRGAHFIMDGIWPPSCVACGAAATQHGSVCATCWGRLGLIAGACCRYCGVSIHGDDDPICEYCFDQPRPWDHGFAACYYQELSRELVLGLKHSGRQNLAPLMARLMYLRAREAVMECDVLTAMPLHWSRAIYRGYNQAALIGHFLAKEAKIDFDYRVLRRVRATPPQAQGSNFDKRFKNLNRALISPSSSQLAVMGRHIGIVDDVMTSGASLDASTRVLKEAGASEVSVFVFARAGQAD